MIVIVGSGIAGLSAALAATGGLGPEADAVGHDAEVLLVSKGSFLESNTLHAQGGVAAALFHDDDPSLHAQDTLAAGDGLCDPTAVDVLTTAGVQRMNELLAEGVHFDRADDGSLLRGLEAAHSKPRVVHAGGDATGRVLEHDVAALVLANPRIHLLEYAFLTDLRISDGRVCGITVLLDVGAGHDGGKGNDSYTAGLIDRARRSPSHRIDIDAGSVILATGGSGQLYPYTTNPEIATGDGVAAAWRAGAQIADLEFYQFHPTALAVGEHFLISEAVRGEGAQLLDEQGVRFMPGVDRRAELAPRDVVARANFAVMQRQSGRPVRLDLSTVKVPDGKDDTLESFLRRRFPTIDAYTHSLGFHWESQTIPVTPAAHYSMGGICTDVYGRSSIPGLYAAGECARSGVHGANRLASNSLLEAMVFGHRAGISALRDGEALEGKHAPLDHTSDEAADGYAQRRPHDHWQVASPHAVKQRLTAIEIPDYGNTRSDDGGQSAIWERDRIQHEMWTHVGVLREQSGLQQAVSSLGVALTRADGCCRKQSTQEQAISDREAEHSYDEDVRALENRNLLTIGYLSARAALERRESRGAHARTDFPDTDAEAVSRRYVLASATAAASTTDRTLPIPVFSSTTYTEASYAQSSHAQSSYTQSTQRHDRPGRVQGAENEGNGKTC